MQTVGIRGARHNGGWKVGVKVPSVLPEGWRWAYEGSSLHCLAYEKGEDKILVAIEKAAPYVTISRPGRSLRFSEAVVLVKKVLPGVDFLERPGVYVEDEIMPVMYLAIVEPHSDNPHYVS